MTSSKPILAKVVLCPDCGYDMAGLLAATEVQCPECGRYLEQRELMPRPLFPPLTRFALRLALPHAIGSAGIVSIAGLCMLLPKDASVLGASIVACYLPVATTFMGAIDAASYCALFAPQQRKWRYTLAATIIPIVGGMVELAVAIVMARALVR